MRWFGHLAKMPLGRINRDVFLARPVVRKPRVKPKTSDYISPPTWEHIRIAQSELVDVTWEREDWGFTCFSLMKSLLFVFFKSFGSNEGVQSFRAQLFCHPGIFCWCCRHHSLVE